MGVGMPMGSQMEQQVAHEMALRDEYEKQKAMKQHERKLAELKLFQQINQVPPVPVIKEKTSMGTEYVKSYFMKHRELLMGFTIFVLLDHFVFGGAFREKIKRIVHSMLDKAENKLTSLDPPAGSTGEKAA